MVAGTLSDTELLLAMLPVDRVTAARIDRMIRKYARDDSATFVKRRHRRSTLWAACYSQYRGRCGRSAHAELEKSWAQNSKGQIVPISIENALQSHIWEGRELWSGPGQHVPVNAKKVEERLGNGIKVMPPAALMMRKVCKRALPRQELLQTGDAPRPKTTV